MWKVRQHCCGWPYSVHSKCMVMLNDRRCCKACFSFGSRLPLGILMVPSIYTITGKWDGIMKFSSALGQRAHAGNR